MKKILKKEDFFYLGIILLYFIWFYSSNYNVGTINNIDEGYFMSLFYRTSIGEMPFRDFNWIYGPSMLYYYAALYNLFSVSIITARIGYLVLYFLVVILTYFLAKKLMPSFFAFLSSLLLIGILKLFNAMYPHIGCTVSGVVILFFILNYLQSKDKKYLFFAGIFCGFSMTVKMNIGLGMLASIIIFLVLNYILESWINGNKVELFNKDLLKAIFSYLGSALIVAVPVYFYFYYGINATQIKQAIPWYSIYHFYKVGWKGEPTSFTILGLKQWFLGEPLVPLFVRILPVCFIIILIYKFYFKKYTFFEKSILLLTLFMLSISVESFVYVGKIQYAQPIIFISFVYLLFLIKESAKNKMVQYAFWCFVILFYFLYIYAYSIVPIVKKNVMFGKYLGLKRAHVYVPDNQGARNFLEIIKFIQENTAPGEKIFALPFDSFLYFYSERDNATRADSMEYGLIYSENDENEIINGLKKNNPRFVFISSRIKMEENLGVIWGVTYQKNIKKYIFDNYHFYKQIGDFKAKNNAELQEHYSCRIYEINKR